jgi:muconolactone delta-isomerase
MKFLILQRIRANVPVKELAVLLPAQIKYYEGLQATGKVKDYYHMIGQHGHALICDAVTDDELSAIIGRDPLFFHSIREVYPLTTTQTHKKFVKEIIGEDTLAI